MKKSVIIFAKKYRSIILTLILSLILYIYMYRYMYYPSIGIAVTWGISRGRAARDDLGRTLTVFVSISIRSCIPYLFVFFMDGQKKYNCIIIMIIVFINFIILCLRALLRYTVHCCCIFIVLFFIVIFNSDRDDERRLGDDSVVCCFIKLIVCLSLSFYFKLSIGAPCFFCSCIPFLLLILR